ncbi:class I SAM-dependent methyltransferase [Sutcliffiella sp. NC1]|nr:class I SAM-dependent methyltransferase [Sutcliffiella sp. NC1]WBL17590.1 class I SAM-dependent methyltransferase [Sutcliffiella sp. NC1]
MDRMIKRDWRAELLSNATGRVLEVGIGTGGNLTFYPEHIESLTGVDFSKGMLNHARKKVTQLNKKFPIELMEADIQDLPFENNSFDTIISTCVFCSVPDPIIGLKELGRVCKPDGTILMLEHMRSEHRLIGWAMDIMNPITVNIWGANINRDTIKNIEYADLKIESDSRLMGSILKRLSVKPNKVFQSRAL